MTVDAETRARLSAGASSDPVYKMVASALAEFCPRGGKLIDVGCGSGRLWSAVRRSFERYVGVDILRFDGFPAEGEFVPANLDDCQIPLPDATAQVVVAAETIEHLENPRQCVRELTRLCQPGGWVVVTTPNQLSLLSKMSLVLLNEFSWFRGHNLPAHITALLEVDLRRIATECGLTEIAIRFSSRGRIPGTAAHYPRFLNKLSPRAFSDNILIVARKPSRS